MASANPVGSSVHAAADLIDQVLESSGPTEPEKEDVAEPEDDEDVKEEEAASPQDDEADAEAEADGLSLEELPGTIAEFAEEMGLEAGDLSGHLKIPVTVNGETRMVNLTEAQKGYQLEADYRAKTAELSEQRRTFDEAKDQAVQEWQTRFQSLQNLTSQLEQSLVGDADLLQVLETDGVEAYHHAKAQQDVRKSVLADAEKQRLEAEKHMNQQNEQKQANFLAGEREALLREMPELADKKKADDFGDRVQTALSGYGYSAQEISQVLDHRHYLLIRDAMSWRELKNSQPGVKNKLKALPKVQKPGAKPEKGDVKIGRNKALMSKLRKSGTRGDAAAVFEEMLS